MEKEENIYINIYPPSLNYIRNNKKEIYDITNEIKIKTQPEEILNDLSNKYSNNTNLNNLINKFSDKIKIGFQKLISATTTKPNARYHLEKTFQCHELPITKIQFNKKGDKFITSSYDAKAILWDRYKGNAIMEYTSHTNVVNSIKFNNNEDKILTGSFDETAKLYNVSDGKCINSY